MVSAFAFYFDSMGSNTGKIQIPMTLENDENIMVNIKLVVSSTLTILHLTIVPIHEFLLP